jgi:hypothetical protein
MGESRSEHNPIHASGDGALEKAERLAPLEEQTQRLSQNWKNEGTLDVDTGSLTLPGELSGREKGKKQLFGLEPITIVIMVLSLAFIGFIAYLISTEAPKPTEEPAPASIERQP